MWKRVERIEYKVNEIEQEYSRVRSRRQSSSKAKKKKSRSNRLVKGIVTVVCLVLSVVLMYAAKAFIDFQNSMNQIQGEVNTNNLRDQRINAGDGKPFSILLMGVDTGEEDREDGLDTGRSDTLMIVTVNPSTQTTTMVSVPRDTYAEIVGNGTYDKINHSYAFGGPAMTINSVQKLLNVPIDYYIAVNMKGLTEVVDSVGGVEVTSPLTFSLSGYSFMEGETRVLNGYEALAYARMRYDDPEGDYGRQKRQRQIIEAIVRKALSIQSVLNYDDILRSMENNVKTNFNMSDVFNVQQHHLPAFNQFESDTIAGESMLINEIFYFYIEPEELLRVSNLLRRSLGLEDSTLEDVGAVNIQSNTSVRGGSQDVQRTYSPQNTTSTSTNASSQQSSSIPQSNTYSSSSSQGSAASTSSAASSASSSSSSSASSSSTSNDESSSSSSTGDASQGDTTPPSSGDSGTPPTNTTPPPSTSTSPTAPPSTGGN